jgi:hypothetical protein
MNTFCKTSVLGVLRGATEVFVDGGLVTEGVGGCLCGWSVGFGVAGVWVGGTWGRGWWVCG